MWEETTQICQASTFGGLKAAIRLLVLDQMSFTKADFAPDVVTVYTLQSFHLTDNQRYWNLCGKWSSSEAKWTSKAAQGWPVCRPCDSVQLQQQRDNLHLTHPLIHSLATASKDRPLLRTIAIRSCPPSAVSLQSAPVLDRRLTASIMLFMPPGVLLSHHTRHDAG